MNKIDIGRESTFENSSPVGGFFDADGTSVRGKYKDQE